MVRQGFKPCRGCQTLSGRFDSGCLPPVASRAFLGRLSRWASARKTKSLIQKTYRNRLGAGLYYGAGASEALLTTGEHVYVVGGGNSAGQAALHFAAFASRVTVVVRGTSLANSLSRYLIDRILATENVEVLTHTEVIALHGDDELRGITLIDRASGLQRTAETRWLFVCIGAAPRTEWAPEVGVMRDEGGYLLTGPDLVDKGRLPDSWPLDRSPYYLETNVPGIFAIGDVRHGSVKRCASAVGEGAMVVALVHRYLAEG